MAGDAKKLYKQLHDEKMGTSPNDLQMLGPPSTIDKLGVSPTATLTGTSPIASYIRSTSSSSQNGDQDLLGELSKSCHASIDIVSRKTLFYLISTLNASYQPDYDFSNSPSSEFSKEPSFDFVLKSVENCLATVENYTRAKQQLWDAIDKEICLAECEFYSYNPDLTSDPCAEDGCLWSFNYFFYNKKMKRIVFFSCRCNSTSCDSSYDDQAEMDDEEMLDTSHNNEGNDMLSMWTFNFSAPTSSSTSGAGNPNSNNGNAANKSSATTVS